jgi:hypothetical protein
MNGCLDADDLYCGKVYIYFWPPLKIIVGLIKKI